MVLYTDKNDGIVKLDGVALEGVLQSLSVNGEIVIDSNNTASTTQSRKIMRGYKDKTVALTLRVVPSDFKTVYEILEDIENLFQDKANDIPKVMMLSNPHTIARGIDEVLLTSVSSSEDNSTNTLNVTLNFEEFISAQYSQGDS